MACCRKPLRIFSEFSIVKHSYHARTRIGILLGSSFELGNSRERKTEGHGRYRRKDGIIPFVMSLQELSSIERVEDEVCRADRKVLGATEASNNSRFIYLVFYFLVTSADNLMRRQEKIHDIEMLHRN